MEMQNMEVVTIKELNEMDVAFSQLENDNYMSEHADALFVSISLQRFEHTKELAKLLINCLYEQYPLVIQRKIDEQLNKAIEKVKSRKYYFVNGHYEREKNV
jgi:hypothetical protein